MVGADDTKTINRPALHNHQSLATIPHDIENATRFSAPLHTYEKCLMSRRSHLGTTISSAPTLHIIRTTRMIRLESKVIAARLAWYAKSTSDIDQVADCSDSVMADASRLDHDEGPVSCEVQSWWHEGDHELLVSCISSLTSISCSAVHEPSRRTRSIKRAMKTQD